VGIGANRLHPPYAFNPVGWVEPFEAQDKLRDTDQSLDPSAKLGTRPAIPLLSSIAGF